MCSKNNILVGKTVLFISAYKDLVELREYLNLKSCKLIPTKMWVSYNYISLLTSLFFQTIVYNTIQTDIFHLFSLSKLMGRKPFSYCSSKVIFYVVDRMKPKFLRNYIYKAVLALPNMSILKMYIIFCFSKTKSHFGQTIYQLTLKFPCCIIRTT